MSNDTPSGSPIPIHRINLCLPPSDRYVSLATLYASRMRAMLPVFDQLITSLSPQIPLRLVHHLARLFLRGLWSTEETEEIRGIARVTGIEVYFLVCLNTVLDLLMGCSSGGILARSTKRGEGRGMVHFRTLDWGMDPLRELVVQLDFVRDASGSDEGEGEVLASSITYVGFVGVLTGVRKGLSASLNFRPVHNDRPGMGGNLAFYVNHLLVLLGRRQSISSLIRECIFAPLQESSSRQKKKKKEISDLRNIQKNIPGIPTTAAYLILSDGTTTLAMEKDYKTAVIRSSSSFIVTTNHDQPPPPSASDTDTDRVGKEKKKKMGNHLGLTLVSSEVQTIEDLIEESTERYECIQARWDEKVRRHQKQILRNADQAERGTRSSLRLRQKREEDAELSVTREEAIEWLTMYPVLNESTHYACLMDPKEGQVVWRRRYDASEWE